MKDKFSGIEISYELRKAKIKEEMGTELLSMCLKFFDDISDTFSFFKDCLSEERFFNGSLKLIVKRSMEYGESLKLGKLNYSDVLPNATHEYLYFMAMEYYKDYEKALNFLRSLNQMKWLKSVFEVAFDYLIVEEKLCRNCGSQELVSASNYGGGGDYDEPCYIDYCEECGYVW